MSEARRGGDVLFEVTGSWDYIDATRLPTRRATQKVKKSGTHVVHLKKPSDGHRRQPDRHVKAERSLSISYTESSPAILSRSVSTKHPRPHHPTTPRSLHPP